MKKKEMTNKIRIPKSFCLFGQKINVVLDNNLVEDEGDIGQTLYRKNLIKLQKVSITGRPETHLEETFIHELVHMILHKMNEQELNDNEKFVDILSSLLHQAFQTMEY